MNNKKSITGTNNVDNVDMLEDIHLSKKKILKMKIIL